MIYFNNKHDFPLNRVQLDIDRMSFKCFDTVNYKIALPWTLNFSFDLYVSHK